MSESDVINKTYTCEKNIIWYVEEYKPYKMNPPCNPMYDNPPDNSPQNPPYNPPRKPRR